MESLENQEVIELYPTELTEVKILWADLQAKYGRKLATVENMRYFRDEAEQRFAEIGLRVIVDTANLELTGDADDFIVSPVIEVVGRISPEEMDFGRMARETQWGYADLRPGTITQDGRWVDPQKFM